MQATGQDIIQLALDRALGPGGEHDQEVVSLVARHSRTLLDSLNTEPSTSVGGVIRVPLVPIPPGRSFFTWGPGGDIVEELPTNIVSWNAIDQAGQEYPRGARMLNSREFAALQFEKDTESSFLSYLYWPRTLDDTGRYTFHFWPSTEGAPLSPGDPAPTTGSGIALYATVPKIREIALDGNYQIDPGRAEFLVTQLAVMACEVVGMPVSPTLRAAAREAAIRAGSFAREDNTLHMPGRRYLIGGRAGRRYGIYPGY